MIQIFLFIFLNFSFGEGLSLTDCFREAKKNNEAVSTQVEVIKQFEENKKQATGALFPTVNANYNVTWQRNVQSPTQGSISPPYNPLGFVSVTQPLFHGGAEYSGLKKAKADFRQQVVLLETAKIQLYENLATTFYSILSLEQDLKNLEQEVKYYDERIQELDRFLKIGRSQPTDVLTVKTARSSLLMQVQQIKGQLAAYRETLAFQTGLAADIKLKEPQTSPVSTIEPVKYFTDKRDSRPDVRANREAISSAEDQALMAKEAHLPVLDLTYDRYFERAGYAAQVNWDAKLMVTVPIFAGGITQSRVRQAISKKDQAQLALSQAQRAADQEIQTAHAAVTADLLQITQAKETARISEQTFKQEQHDFRLGLVTNLDVLTSLTNYIEALRFLDKGRFSLRADLAHLYAAAMMDIESDLL